MRPTLNRTTALALLFATTLTAGCGGTAQQPAACSDQCTAGAVECASGGVQTCAQQASGCADWSAPVACDSGLVCSGGVCAASCNDQCTSGATRCSGNGVQTCGKQASGCTDWNPAVACGGGACESGQCVAGPAGCTDACTEGATQCALGGITTCAKQTSGCTDWGVVTDCNAGLVCSGGQCVTTCTNQCTAGATQCSTGGVQSCARQSTGCTDWNSAVACGSAESCSAGSCQSVCGSCSSGQACVAGANGHACVPSADVSIDLQMVPEYMESTGSIPPNNLTGPGARAVCLNDSFFDTLTITAADAGQWSLTAQVPAFDATHLDKLYSAPGPISVQLTGVPGAADGTYTPDPASTLGCVVYTMSTVAGDPTGWGLHVQISCVITNGTASFSMIFRADCTGYEQ